MSTRPSRQRVIVISTDRDSGGEVLLEVSRYLLELALRVSRQYIMEKRVVVASSSLEISLPIDIRVLFYKNTSTPLL